MGSFIKHTGTPRHSGRYPWGSGDDPEQRNTSFSGYVNRLKKSGVSEVDIAKSMNMSTLELRQKLSTEKAEEKAADRSMALRLKEKGLSNVAIGKRMGRNESSVRALLDPILEEKANITKVIAEQLRSAVDSKEYLDVGAGTEVNLSISRTKLDTAISLLQAEGYKMHYVKERQLGTGKYTSYRVLTKPDVTYSDVSKNRDKIVPMTGHFEENGRIYEPVQPPVNVNSKRISVRYKEDGGSDKDGVIEIRRGVEDLSLGSKNYGQVRVAVDGTHYLKGMAMYSDDIPAGKDIIFNTNKQRGTPLLGPKNNTVAKILETDPERPFGSDVRQKKYVDSKGKEHLSALNMVNEEGSWDDWNRTLSSQMLSKQLPPLAKKQLAKALAKKQTEYEEIMSCTNPAVKKRLLEAFADDCDASSVHLKAAALPRQATKVILPLTSLKENEVFAPTYHDGEPVVLIRHPHGGTFEIPELIVNNKNPEGRRLLTKDAPDAIGIHPKVAQQLSGADFDGDTVLVIPNRNRDVRTSAPLKGLKDFDSKLAYPYRDGMKVMGKVQKERAMGDISNLITDMTIMGANENEICRAVRHSMVIIDAEKHKLDYQTSAIDNNIAGLKKKYQGGERSGAATLISRAKSEERVPLRKDTYSIDPVTGKKQYQYLTNTYRVNSKGQKVRVTVDSVEKLSEYGPVSRIVNTKKVKDPITGKISYVPTKDKVILSKTISTKMAEADDAFKLSSGHRMESIYAEYANNLKSLANKSRLEVLNTEDAPYSPSARKVYDKEVSSLKAKLRLAFMNKPLERRAQLIGNAAVSKKRAANPDMEKDALKKLKGKELIRARLITGAKKQQIVLTDKEWEAIQAGAIHKSLLEQIILNADLDVLKQRATPRPITIMSTTMRSRAKQMLKLGATPAEVAQALGVSTSTIATINE